MYEKAEMASSGVLGSASSNFDRYGSKHRFVTIANIPFPFTVANRTLPPGRYTITRMGETNLRISDLRNQGTFVQAHNVEGKALDSRGKNGFSSLR